MLACKPLVAALGDRKLAGFQASKHCVNSADLGQAGLELAESSPASLRNVEQVLRGAAGSLDLGSRQVCMWLLCGLQEQALWGLRAEPRLTRAGRQGHQYAGLAPRTSHSRCRRAMLRK